MFPAYSPPFISFRRPKILFYLIYHKDLDPSLSYQIQCNAHEWIIIERDHRIEFIPNRLRHLEMVTFPRHFISEELAWGFGEMVLLSGFNSPSPFGATGNNILYKSVRLTEITAFFPSINIAQNRSNGLLKMAGWNLMFFFFLLSGCRGTSPALSSFVYPFLQVRNKIIDCSSAGHVQTAAFPNVLVMYLVM